jgi:hypothetical protein
MKNLQKIVKKFAPRGTLVRTWQLGKDIMMIQKVEKAYTFTYEYKTKKKMK